MNRRRVVRVPASSANLGPGFDVLAAALDIRLELEVSECGEFSVECDVPGVPLDRGNLCVRAFERLHPADGVSFSIRSQIPLSAGLGSSAAAIVAGLCAADHMYELDAPLFDLAAEMEGHPDNVAAALLGGFVVCAGEPVRFDPPAGLEGVLAIPAFEVPDDGGQGGAAAGGPARGRGAQRRPGIAADAGAGPGRLLADRRAGCATCCTSRAGGRCIRGRWSWWSAPRTLGAVGATISGAGPTVLFWSHWEQTGSLVERLRTAAPDCTVKRVTFAPGGADVNEL